MIPQADSSLRLKKYEARILKDLHQLLKAGQYIFGPQTDAFEQEFADYVGVRHCVSVGSGTDAISLALMGLAVEPHAEIITVSMTAAGTAVGIVRAGAQPRFVDVDPHTRCMGVSELTAAITPATQAIVPVHLYGFPAPMHEICGIAERYGLVVVEDCAQAHGATLDGVRVGSFGDAAAFSFYPTKNLGGVGDGGAVVTDQWDVARRAKSLREYGWDSERICAEVGFNSRLGEVQASVLRLMLNDLDARNDNRRNAARQLSTALSDLPIILPVYSEGAVFHQYVIEANNRELLREKLRRLGVDTAVHYPVGLHEQPAFSGVMGGSGLPVTESLSRCVVSLPIEPELIWPNMNTVVESLKEALQ